MTGGTMKGERCWSAESVGQTVFSDIGALASDADPLFLAAHTSVDLDHLKGPEVLGRTGEEQVLNALLGHVGDRERNTLIAVTGASGSGKSHVVRWVHAHLDLNDARFKVLYVPRAVQTIRELLRRIIEGLPGVEGRDLLERVDDAVVGKAPGELQDSLVAQMRIDLNWTLDDRIAFDGETADERAAREDRNGLLGVRDQEGRRRDGLADLLEVPAINTMLLRPDGALRHLVESYLTETSRRDDDDEIFTRDDLPLRERGVLGSLAGRPELKELWQIISRQPDDALRLLEEALRSALPKTLGLRSAGGETLDSLFRASRKALREQGQELLLIFEDLAQFGLVDGELYDQFVTHPGDDMSPLRVVFAVTDGAFGKMERTVRTRVEHEFHVGGSVLAEPDQFLGRYFNLVRVGRDHTQALWAATANDTERSDWMANACDTREEGQPCRYRDVCHDSFGAVEISGLGRVGLYPYNPEALDRALKGTDRRALERTGIAATPRDVLDECVAANLQEADHHIADGTYPHERTRRTFDFSTRMGKDALLAHNPSSDPERTYRALVIWGDETPLREGVLDAFSLDSEAAESTPPPPPRPTTEPTAELPNPLLALFQWQNDDDLPEDDVNTFRSTLHALTLTRLNLDQFLAHVHSGRGKQVLDELFNATSFSLEGARGRRAGGNSVRFELVRDPEDVRVLAAARWFRDHGHFVPSLGTWKWPEGYDPVQLMVGLETRLDAWAAVVRARFLDATGGTRLAKQAVGVRALALAATGRSPAQFVSTAAVLARPTEARLNPSEAWSAVEEIASRIVAVLQADDYVGEFAAVRQGETGQPQLVDTQELDQALSGFVDDPLASLAATAELSADPVLAQAAKQLLDAASSAVAAEAAHSTEVTEKVTTLLEGLSPVLVGERAAEVGRSAREAGLFRPVESWAAFQQAVDFLSASGVEPPSVPKGADLKTVLLNQNASRSLTRISSALDAATKAMAATQQECQRSGSAAGDVSELKTVVKSQVGELDKLVKSLARKA